MKPGLIPWGGWMLARHGWPRGLVRTYVGLGDELMTAAAFRELQSRGRAGGLWFMARYPEIWRDSGVDSSILPWDARAVRLAERLAVPVVDLGYVDPAAPAGVDRPLAGHAIATFCRQLGVRGRVALKPHLRLSPAERAAGRLYSRQVAIQSSNAGGSIAIALKKWPLENFQRVADALAAAGWNVVQLGSPQEPALAGATDLRGKTSVRQAAAVLAGSRLFVGLVGGLMHLARAVDCPAVVVYGGREEPELAGYSANVNLTARPACAPCYFHYHCPEELRCMTMIGPEQVIAAAARRLAAEPAPLPVDWAEI